MVDAEVARIGLVGLRGVDDSDVGSTTTLGVLDSGTGGLAGRSVLASRSVRHGVVELQITVELGRNLERLDGRLVVALALVARDLGGAVLVRAGGTRDTLALEGGPGAQLISLAELVRARKAGPLESLVGVETSEGKIGPVESATEVGETHVVGVIRAREFGGIMETCGHNLADASSQGDERQGVLHFDYLFVNFWL